MSPQPYISNIDISQRIRKEFLNIPNVGNSGVGAKAKETMEEHLTMSLMPSGIQCKL